MIPVNQTSILKLQSAFAVLCLLSSVLCPPVRAGGSWLVDGQAVQSLEVQTTNDDPAALHTDGSRPMLGPLQFDPSVSSPYSGLFQAYAPWDEEMYDFFIIDENEDAVRLCGSRVQFFPNMDLSVAGSSLTDVNNNNSIDIGGTTLNGGTWMVDGVGASDDCIISKGFADNRFVRQDAVTAPLVYDTSVSNLFQAYTPWDGMTDFFIVDEDAEAIHLSNGQGGFFPTEDLYISANIIGNALGPGRVDLGETSLLGGTWMVDAVGPYDECIITRGFADNRYVQQSTGITTNHTLQAGDVLQIQNGTITAINP